MESSRLRNLPRRRVLGSVVPVATGFRSRLFGLAGLEPAEAEHGLLIPGCASVHTFGMRFELDLYFLDEGGRLISVQRRVPPRRVVRQAGASAVLELPAGKGGESAAPAA
jgi:uncharacterized membrane protein (UPF0127 family)